MANPNTYLIHEELFAGKYCLAGSYVDFETWQAAVGKENVVVPLFDFGYSHVNGPMYFRKGRPTEIADAALRRELRLGGFIA